MLVKNIKEKETEELFKASEPVEEKKFKVIFEQNLKFVFAGAWFGFVLIKSEVISWYRIQEMFRLDSFHMYGVIGTAVLTGMLSVFTLKKLGIKSLDDQEITINPKKFQKGQILGGLCFGIGWAITGACPGPIYAQIGAGVSTTIVTVISAIFGVWVYGRLRHKLPH